MNTILTSLLNAVLLGLFLVALGAAFGRIHPLIDLFGHFLFAAIAGAILLVTLALLTGRHVTATLAVVALLTNLLIALPWLQSNAAVQADGTRFKVLSFNVFVYNPRFDLVAKLVREANADIVVLYEIVPRVRKELDALASEFPHRLECWQEKQCDILILSRLPLQDLRPSWPPPKLRRPLAGARVTIGQRTLTLFAAHLSLPYPLERRRTAQMDEAREVAEVVNNVAGPRLLVGDFNASPWSASLGLIRTFAALDVLTGPGGTWPSFLPKHVAIPIDHVLASRDVALLSRRLITVFGSDHRAVLAEIAFRD
jgi:endonuclease/exonuclease/phosphatase (EEP) superfamily protein YafD